MKKINFKKKINSLLILLPQKIYLKVMFRMVFGKKLSLKKPKTFTEKIQWRKVYGGNRLLPICTDKFSVREYVSERIGNKYLIPLYYATKNPSKIPFEKLRIPFIVKPNHTSGQLIIIKNKDEIKKEIIVNRCDKWLKEDFYFNSKEAHYKKIDPRIIIEKLLLDEKGEIPEDYKFHCFHGKVEFIQVCQGRFNNYKLTLFDKNWKPCSFTLCPKINGKPKYKQDKNTPKPKNLKEMVKVAEKLSRDFDYVRVDLYSVKNKIYFGELTFTPASGFSSFFPEKYDLIYGKKWTLKKSNS